MGWQLDIGLDSVLGERLFGIREGWLAPVAAAGGWEGGTIPQPNRSRWAS